MGSPSGLVSAVSSPTYRVVTFGRSQLKELLDGNWNTPLPDIPDLACEIADSAFLAVLLSGGSYDFSDFKEYRPGHFESGFFPITVERQENEGKVESHLLEFEYQRRRFSVEVAANPSGQVLAMIQDEMGLAGVDDFISQPIDLSNLTFAASLQLAYINFPCGLKLDNSRFLAGFRFALYSCRASVEFRIVNVSIGETVSIQTLILLPNEKFSCFGSARSGSVQLRDGNFKGVIIKGYHVEVRNCSFLQSIPAEVPAGNQLPDADGFTQHTTFPEEFYASSQMIVEDSEFQNANFVMTDAVSETRTMAFG